MREYFTGIYNGVKSLCAGLRVTLRHCWAPRITLEYPERRADLPLRFRGRLALPVDPATGRDRCTGCLLCVKACPNYSVEVTRALSEDGKPLPRASKYIYRMETCLYCNLCVEACPFAALVMTEDYECATADRGALTLDLVAERYELKGKKLPWWLAKYKGGQS